MKRIFVLSMLIPVAMMCSCQKQDSAAEVQLAQRKAELDARERAFDEKLNSLDERVNSLDQRVKELAEKQKAITTSGVIESRDQVPDPAQAQAERDRTIQQVPAEFRSMIGNDAKMKGEREREIKAQRTQTQHGLEKLQSQKQRKSQMSSGAVFPSAETTSPTSSPAVEVSSPTASPAVEDTSSTPSSTPQ